jgi:uncharacterized membrane protein HdeD (DUF308 family)
VLILAGIAAFVFPLVASIAVKLMFGWLMLLVGAVTLWHAVQTRRWESVLWNGLIAVLLLAVGVYLAFFPLTGLIGLTLILGVTFLMQGVFEAMIAMQNRSRRGWGWLMASGGVSIVLGVMLIAGLPGTAVWALGLLMGIHFLTSGVSLLALARAA